MEQQKITQNPLSDSQSNLNIADISNTYQKTLRSFHNISNSNIKSKSKLGSGPQFVISYNFQNDPNCQVRTHNLLIGLGEISESHPKKNTFRKNAVLRSNHNSNSHSNLRNSRNESEHLRNKLIHVRSNEILSSKYHQPDTTVQSFYTKQSNPKHYPQSFTHGNTFWRDDRDSFGEGRKHHEQQIISNVQKIAHRNNSSNKNKINANVYANSIQKISRNKLNESGKKGLKQNQVKNLNSNFIYELPDADLLQRDQANRLTKRHKKDENYNEKLQNILRKTKRQKTKSDLKAAYAKQQQSSFINHETKKVGNLHSKVRSSLNKMSPKSKTNHENKVEKLTSFIEHPKPQSQHQATNFEREQNTSFDQINPLKNPHSFSQLDSATQSILEYQKGIIERENTQKPKRKYHQLIKNAKVTSKNSHAEEFHRIESENQNEMGSSKKGSKDEIPENNLPDKSFNESINNHFKENSQNTNEVQISIPVETNSGIVLQKLQLNKKESNEQALKPSKSTNRNNYHAPTTYEGNVKFDPKDRKRLNSNIDYKSNSLSFEREDGITKRKVPADYNEFLKMLSEQNQKKRQIEEMFRQRELSLNAQKTSRFQNLQDQNQHIRRVLVPIKNSFMEERRKRLSDQRKSQRKQRKLQKLNNPDGSIIQSDSQSESKSGIRSPKRKQLKQKLKNRSQQSRTNSEAESKSKRKNFIDSLRNSVDRMKRDSEKNSPQKSTFNQTQKQANENQPKAKLNSVKFSNEEEKDMKQQEYQQGNDESEKSDQETKKIQRLTGMKIPQKAVERSKSRRFLKRTSDQNSNSEEQKLMDQNNGTDPQERLSKAIQQGNKTQNRFSKNKNAFKNGKDISGKRQSQQTNQEKESSSKAIQNKKIKPVDKRVAQDKKRKFKNWNESEQTQKRQKQKLHTKKDGKLNKKIWKDAKKAEKNKQEKVVAIQDADHESDDQQSNSDSHAIKNQLKKARKPKKKQLDENGEQIEVQNSDEEKEEQSSYIDLGQEGDRSQQKLEKQKKIIQARDELEKQDVEEKEHTENQNLESNSNHPQHQGTNAVQKRLSKNYNLQRISKRESVPSIHKNVQQSEGKNNLEEKPKVQTSKERQSRASQSVQISNKASIESVIESQKIQTPHSQNNSQQTKQQSAQNQPNNKETANFQQPVQNQPQRQQSASNHTEYLSKQMAEEKKQEMIQNVIQNQQMKQNGFMEITESKFDIYNHQSQKSVIDNLLQPIPQMDSQQLEKRAEIVKFLYSLPVQNRKEITKFLPDETLDRLLSSVSFSRKDANAFKNIRISRLRTALEELAVFDHLNPKITQQKTRKNEDQSQKNNFLKKIFEPYQSLSGQIGVWMYCVGVWRLITVHQNEIERNQAQSNYENLLFLCLEKAFEKSLKIYYSGLSVEKIEHEQVLRMLTGLRISILVNNKGKKERIFRQIEYNIRKNHIIRAISMLDTKFFKQTINCVRKIETTSTGQKVLQIVSTSISEIQLKPRYFWIREDKFSQFFTSFTIMSRRSTQSYWTNDSIKIANQQKAVYMIDSTQKHTSGSITLYPLDSDFSSNKQKCTIAFYKQIEPQVLKLVGKAMEKLPEKKESVHTTKLYFEFNIKGTYYVFLELENGLYNVAIESNSPEMRLNFIEYVKKETNKNEQCEYVEIDKIFKKKPNINTFQTSNQLKQLMNFMKKTSPEVYQPK